MTLAPNTLRPTESPEFPIRGPFGGIQSEAAPDAIDSLGFLDILNLICFRAAMQVRPGFTALTAFANPQEPIAGVMDFFTSTATRKSVIVTPTRAFVWNPAGAGSWTLIGGAALTGATTSLFGWTVCGQKLCLCQGADKVKVWDGVGNLVDAAAGAVPAKYLAEIANHLVVANTIEGGNAAPQRVRWTGPGDPTDWVSVNSGQTDLFNDLGPINGLLKLYQSGYAFQQWGITQIIPTGNALIPYQFVALSAHSKGLIAPYSLAAFGEQIAAYVGKDNVYIFNGTSSEPIGDRPVQGSKTRLGAQSRIFADLKQLNNLMQVTGLVTTSINGFQFNAYWLSVPGISLWCYNFEEENWVRFSYAKTIASMGVFLRSQGLRIIDLIGSIGDQNWTPATIGTTNPFDSIILGMTDGTPALVDFTNVSEQAWSIQTGQLDFGDYRHNKTLTAIRFILTDLAQSVFTVTITNERGQSVSRNVTMGNGSGNAIVYLVDFTPLTGYYLNITISGAAGTSFSLLEMTPIYTVAGEYKNP